jgi:hypothetical protein
MLNVLLKYPTAVALKTLNRSSLTGHLSSISVMPEAKHDLALMSK